MTKFNLTKIAKKTGYRNYSKMLEDRTEEMNLSAEVPSKNVNLKMTTKEKDNTIPYEKQIDAIRQDGDDLTIAEKAINEKEKLFNDRRIKEWDTNVMPINLTTESHVQKQIDVLKKAEEKDKRDTTFWDKWVGVQMEGKTTKVDENIDVSQLENQPDRFSRLDKNNPLSSGTEGKFDEMVTASLKDADAMLFHIYASAYKEKRFLTAGEKQKVIDINNIKSKMIADNLEILKKKKNA